jgi:lambda family phage minor tail protein L
MSDLIATDGLSQSINSGLITLYDIAIVGDDPDNPWDTLYFHSEDDSGTISFKGNTYVALPILIDGIEATSEGATPRPTLTIANVESLLQNAVGEKSPFVTEAESEGQTFEIEDLIGARLTRRKTLEKHLANGYEFPPQTFIVDRIANKNQLTVELELASPFDLAGVRIPGRIVVGKYCPWQYTVYNSRSACSWTDNNQIRGESDPIGSEVLHSFYFNELNEPIINSIVTSETPDPYQGPYAGGTTYDQDDFVTYSGEIYRSQDGSNTGNTPSSSPTWWRICRTYTTWSTDSGATSYTVNTLDPRASSLVFHNNMVWRALIDQLKSDGNTPSASSKFWARADVCGKLLGSCKVRFQVNPVLKGSPSIDLPSASTDTDRVLPFGGFPGTRKFR